MTDPKAIVDPTGSFLNEVQISYHRRPVTLPNGQASPLSSPIQNPQDCERLFRLIWAGTMDYSESMYVLFVSRANLVVSYACLSTGSKSGVIVDAGIVFQLALLTHATGIVLAHNHPSGNLRPSEEDRKLTRKIEAGGRLLDIKLLDHLIITTEGCFSFAEAGDI